MKLLGRHLGPALQDILPSVVAHQEVGERHPPCIDPGPRALPCSPDTPMHSPLDDAETPTWINKKTTVNTEFIILT